MLDHFDVHFIRQREDEAANKGFLGGLLLGVLLGVVLALVFAPRRGEETRAAVAGKASDLRHKAADMVHRTDSEREDVPAPPAETSFDGEVAIEREITVGDEATSHPA